MKPTRNMIQRLRREADRDGSGTVYDNPEDDHGGAGSQREGTLASEWGNKGKQSEDSVKEGELEAVLQMSTKTEPHHVMVAQLRIIG